MESSWAKHYRGESVLQVGFLTPPREALKPTAQTMQTTETERIRSQLRNAIEGGAWHGPSLKEIVGDMRAHEAAQRPLAGVHSPWEIVLHTIVWLETVDRRLRGVGLELTAEEDWPAVSEETQSAWSELLDRLDQAHGSLQRTLAGQDDQALGDRVVGKEYDRYFMLHGTVQHVLYHSGQVALLKKALRPRSALVGTQLRDREVMARDIEPFP